MPLPSVSVVIPAFNEEGALNDLLAECLAALEATGAVFDITVVNDGSTDATPRIIDAWAAKVPGRVKRKDHACRKGLAAAVETAFQSGGNECVFLLHADGQYSPQSIAECLRLIAGADAVILVRKHKFYGPWRELLSCGYRWLPKLLFGVDLRDPGGAKCIRRAVLADIRPVSSGVFRDPERMIRAVRRGKKIEFLPVDIRPRVSGVAQGGRLKLALLSVAEVAGLWWRTAVLRQPW
ncbi:MAG TPA: glycosyltransferase family 2 protein [Candidatus Peribacteria bacterium]|nr:glycosyltransferase family 2 protein [Candidatus Peribacteria bacterium]